MGAHIARLVRTPNPSSSSSFLLLLLSLVSIFAISFAAAADEKDTETEILLAFKDTLENPSSLSNWNASVKPCAKDRSNWIGVVCLNNAVWGLQLENMGLGGHVDVEILAGLKLRTMSLMNNNFEGPLPHGIRQLTTVKTLYLSNNRFSGEIPDDAFQGMEGLRTLVLANNAFTGKIPLSLTTLSKLGTLKLDVNQFVGHIPEFKQPGLKLTLANNLLEGPIPASLSKLSSTSFSGNKNLCGPPLPMPCTTPPPSPPPISPKSEEMERSPIAIALIVVSAILVLVIIAAIFLLSRRRKQNPKPTYDNNNNVDDSNKLPTYDNEGDKLKAAGVDAAGGGLMAKRSEKLIFLKDDIEVFDLQDMLRASAEVLGSGNFGASYKADIAGGEAVVVKRYKHMNNVAREDYHEHMRRLGRLKHQNLLPLLAYYYRKEEKLLVSHFIENGSLASHLHANHTTSLDWPTRLKIVKGVARGLNYLYNELPSLIVPHGHVKSSNVLLDHNFEPLLCDYSLRPVINQERAHKFMTAYKSPEYVITGRISRKTDVWTLGILILEVLTGKFPENYMTANYDSSTSLSTWVNEMVKDKKIGEVFDKEMDGTKNSKGEMINLLKVGLSCCEEDVETRPEMKEVVQKIEELKEGDEDFDDFSSTLGEVNAYAPKGNMPDESFLALNR